MKRFFFLGLFFLTSINIAAADDLQPVVPAGTGLATAIFAGGRFWYLEPAFENLQGVKTVRTGYTGGREENSTYQQVSSGTTGHAEAVEIVYNPKEITYKTLLDVYWRNVDPTTMDRQFNDVGHEYRTVIFYQNEEQHQFAVASKHEIENSKRYDTEIFMEILPVATFYPAEEDQQKYYKKHPFYYKFCRFISGRDRFIRNMWRNKN